MRFKGKNEFSKVVFALRVAFAHNATLREIFWRGSLVLTLPSVFLYYVIRDKEHFKHGILKTFSNWVYIRASPVLQSSSIFAD